MWLLGFIPDSILTWLVHAILGIGVVLFIAGTILGKFLGPGAQVARPLGALLILAGVYFEGGLQNELHWRAEVQRQQAEIERINAAAQEITVKVETKYIDRIKVVKEKQDAIIQKVPEYITAQHDADCIIPDGFRLLHDAAAKNQLPETTSVSDDSTRREP